MNEIENKEDKTYHCRCGGKFKKYDKEKHKKTIKHQTWKNEIINNQE